MSESEQSQKNSKPTDDIISRLQAVKKGHGTYRKCQDAIKEILAQREMVSHKNLVIADLQRKIDDLEKDVKEKTEEARWGRFDTPKAA